MSKTLKAAALAAFTALCPLAITSEARAAGFYVNEQSARGLGRAFSGEAALGGDASALWYNPAHAADFDRPVVTGAASLIYSDGGLVDRGTTLTGPGPTPSRFVGGRAGDDPLETAGVPQASAVIPLANGFAAGLSLNVPFGLVVNYAPDYFGRYDSTRTELTTANVQGTLAWRPSPTWAFGVGLNAQYADAALESALPNLVPGAPDGFSQVTGDDWSLGWNVGALWTPAPAWRVGAAFRSSIEHELEGQQIVRGLVGPLEGANGTSGGAADLETPEIASLGVAFEAAPGWTLMSQVNWFGWSNFRELRVRAATGDTVRRQDYRDALQLAVGVERALSETLSWRAGVLLEETPTRPGVRSSRVPDSDRAWLTGGASWTPRPNLTLDVGAAYVKLAERDVDRVDIIYEGTPAETRLDLRSKIEGDAFIGSLGATFRF